MEVEVRRARASDAEDLAARMRSAEADEVLASDGATPLEAMHLALDKSSEAWSLVVDGELACCWGVAMVSSSVLGGRIGSVWLLSTDVIERHPRVFWKVCLAVIPDLLERWDVLVNAIDARHSKAVRWARRLGFVLEEAQPYGHARLPFHRFNVRKENLRCALQ